MVAKKKAQTEADLKQRVRLLERALRDERAGLLVVCRAAARLCGPERLEKALEAKAQNAVANPRLPPKARDAIVNGFELVKRAREQEEGRPQTLFSNVHVGHIDPELVEKAAGNGEAQLGFEDPSSAAKEQEQVAASVREAIIKIVREEGASPEEVIIRQYVRNDAGPRVPVHMIVAQRNELTRLGRLVNVGKPGNRIYDLRENIS